MPERGEVLEIGKGRIVRQGNRIAILTLGTRLAEALKPGGSIAIHDMLPRDWIEEHVPQISTRAWTGDGWKGAQVTFKP